MRTILIALLTAVLSASLAPGLAMGQTATLDIGPVETSLTPEVAASFWPVAQREYQHAFRAELTGSARWRFVSVRGAWRGTFYKTSDAIVVGSPINAETNRAQEEVRDLSVRLHAGSGFIGARVYRVEQQQVWQKAAQHGYHEGFPPSNDWREARRLCTQTEARPPRGKTEPCAGLHYWDRAGLSMGYDGPRLEAVVTYLGYQWKALTQTPSDWLASVTVRPTDNWYGAVRAELDLRNRVTGTARVQRRLVGRLWVEVSGGRVQPDLRAPIPFGAAGVVVR